MNCEYNIKAVLEIIFKVTKKNADILAHIYLLKDKSIISKWKNNKAIPRNDDISKIVEFVVNESTLSQKKIIRDNIEILIEKEPIKGDLKNIILNTTDFAEFLKEALSLSISLSETDIEPQDIKDTNDSVKNYFAGHIKNKNRRYNGTLEFDLVMPEEHGAKYIKAYGDSGMEFEGKINITPKSRLLRASRYLKKTLVTGILIFIGISMFIYAFIHNSNNQLSSNSQVKDLKILSNKQTDVLTTADIPVHSPTHVIKPTPAISTKPTPVNSLKSSKAPDSLSHSQNINKKVTNKITNTTKNNKKHSTINNSGDGVIIAQGNNITIGIEKD